MLDDYSLEIFGATFEQALDEEYKDKIKDLFMESILILRKTFHSQLSLNKKIE